jgi:hypothetical protein
MRPSIDTPNITRARGALQAAMATALDTPDLQLPVRLGLAGG